MAKKNVTGRCRLCGSTGVLLKSHYLGRALHKLSRDQDGTQVVLTPKLVKKTPHQLWRHLLCPACEHRFNRFGERYTLNLLNRKGQFRLLERMQVSLNLGQDGPATKFSGQDMGIDTEQIAYFILSLLWRGSVASWSTLNGQNTSVNLGAFEEPIRKYLLGETAFPSDVYVVVTVCTDTTSQEFVYAPWVVDVDDGKFQKFEALSRGLWFHTAMGTGVPYGTNQLCCVNSTKKILFMKNCQRDLLDAARALTGGAENLDAAISEGLAPPPATRSNAIRGAA